MSFGSAHDIAVNVTLNGAGRGVKPAGNPFVGTGISAHGTVTLGYPGRAAMPALDTPRPELELALTEPVGEAWADAPVLLLGTPGSGVERVAALLADQPGLVVLRDRIGALQRVDDFNQPRFAHYAGELSEADRLALRERYLGPLRHVGIGPGRTVVDWLATHRPR